MSGGRIETTGLPEGFVPPSASLTPPPSASLTPPPSASLTPPPSASLTPPPAGLWCKCMNGDCTDEPPLPVLRPETARLLGHFSYQHLHGVLAEMSAPFYSLARHLLVTLGESPDLTKALNDLLAAKDWAVRARLPL